MTDIELLQAYKDTGLTPGEIRSLWGEWNAMMSVLNSIGSYDRLRELAKADKDGRLVVLPCKVGDTVFLLVEDKKRVCECSVEYVNISSLDTSLLAIDKFTGWSYGTTARLFGKNVFFTREEAEAALKEHSDE